MKTYEIVQIGEDNETILKMATPDGIVASVPLDPANSDYQAYLAWVAEGNEALASE
jgi:hypothetical protein